MELLHTHRLASGGCNQGRMRSPLPLTRSALTDLLCASHRNHAVVMAESMAGFVASNQKLSANKTIGR